MSARSRRTMRVATVFTGIAACTAIGAPKAFASSGHRITGSIREVNSCSHPANNNPIDSTWLHVNSKNSNVQRCYGFKGDYSPAGEVGIGTQCGGNNYGFLSATSWFITFGEGITFRYLGHPHLDTVYISGWAGDDKCL
jgi:hypothetical protein